MDEIRGVGMQCSGGVGNPTVTELAGPHNEEVRHLRGVLLKEKIMIRFTADHHYVIGHEHVLSGKPCQDHAHVTVAPDFAGAFVSDGCSSGGETDIGARVLTRSTARAALMHWSIAGSLPDPATLNVEQRLVAIDVGRGLGLSFDDMLATSAYVLLTRGGGYAHLVGDGVIAYRKRDGRIFLARYDWANNMPCYPVYGEDEYAGFIKAHGNDPEEKAFTHEEWVWYPDRGFTHMHTIPMTIAAGIRGAHMYFDAIALHEEIDTVAVFTDGVTRIDGMDWKDAALALLAFKQPAGAFVKRRLQRFQKDVRTTGKGPLDDLGYAAIRIANDPEE